MNKKEIDIQLIEACVLEKWNPLAMGCEVEETDCNSCTLCQAYMDIRHANCMGCPIDNSHTECHGTPYEYYACAAPGSSEELDGIEAEIEFLISLLPGEHPWRNEL